MAVLKIIILFLLIGNEERLVTSQSPEDADDATTEKIEANSSMFPNNELTHVRTKNLSGNVRLTTLQVFTTNVPLDKLNNAIEQEEQGTLFVQINLENQDNVGILSEIGTKAPTDGIVSFGLMDVFNSTSGTLPDQTTTEKLIIVTPLNSKFHDNSTSDPGSGNEKDVDVGSAPVGDKEEVLLVFAVAEDLQNNTATKINTTSEQNKYLENETTEVAVVTEAEDIEDMADFIEVDEELLGEIHDETTEIGESGEDVSAIFDKCEKKGMKEFEVFEETRKNEFTDLVETTTSSAFREGKVEIEQNEKNTSTLVEVEESSLTTELNSEITTTSVDNTSINLETENYDLEDVVTSEDQFFSTEASVTILLQSTYLLESLENEGITRETTKISEQFSTTADDEFSKTRHSNEEITTEKYTDSQYNSVVTTKTEDQSGFTTTFYENYTKSVTSSSQTDDKTENNLSTESTDRFSTTEEEEFKATVFQSTIKSEETTESISLETITSTDRLTPTEDKDLGKTVAQSTTVAAEMTESINRFTRTEENRFKDTVAQSKTLAAETTESTDRFTTTEENSFEETVTQLTIKGEETTKSISVETTISTDQLTEEKNIEETTIGIEETATVAGDATTVHEKSKIFETTLQEQPDLTKEEEFPTSDSEKDGVETALFSEQKKNHLSSIVDSLINTPPDQAMLINVTEEEPQRFVLKITINETDLFVPPHAYLTHSPPIVNITWNSSTPHLNNSLQLNSNSVQFNLVQDSRMHTYESVLPPETADKSDVYTKLITLDEGIQIYFSYNQFMKTDQNVTTDAVLVAEIVGGCVGFLVIAVVFIYCCVRNMRREIRDFKPNGDV